MWHFRRLGVGAADRRREAARGAEFLDRQFTLVLPTGWTVCPGVLGRARRSRAARSRFRALGGMTATGQVLARSSRPVQEPNGVPAKPARPGRPTTINWALSESSSRDQAGRPRTTS